MQINAVNGIGSARVGNQPKNASVPKTMESLQNQTSFSKLSSMGLKSNALNFSKQIAFTADLNSVFGVLNTPMTTCDTKDKRGEPVGSRAAINDIVNRFSNDFCQVDDTIKTTIPVSDKTNARTQLKYASGSKVIGAKNVEFDIKVAEKEAGKAGECFSRKNPLKQDIGITITALNYKGQGTKDEDAYILNTKGNLMAVVEDNNNVILTNAARISKKDETTGTLNINAKQYIQDKKSGEIKENVFTPFEPINVEKIQPIKKGPSIGEGGKIVIAMEEGRFTDELKQSLKTFKEKIDNGEIELPQFKAMDNAKETMHFMLAGGFGSRAEYTNASSDAIFHDMPNGAQSTKGVFRTPTGLTPMETTLLSLHESGAVDLSKIEFNGPDANVLFYENRSHVNKGNGGFSLDAVKKMATPETKTAMFYANDAMSRTTNAIKNTCEIMNNGNSAITLIAKEIPSQDCIKTFGIMKTDDDNKILEFAEKPEKIEAGYEVVHKDKNGKDKAYCLTNAFQFGVNIDTFKVLDMVEPFFSKNSKDKETRDWSKQYIPIIKTLAQNDDYEKIRQELAPIFGTGSTPIDNETIAKAKELLKGKDIYAVPTSEPWADCGSLNALYHTTMQIASGDFPLEPFEVKNVLKCVNAKSGLVVSNPEIKKEIEDKYDINGQVMVVPQAQKVNPEDVADIPVVYNERQKA